uniref:Taste receptor type 2 n=1 Tax=Leptobrachium leishanense TaxID=445787 RepID=A0A8C5QNN8_9ANUR
MKNRGLQSVSMDSEVAAVCLSIMIVLAAIGSLANGFVVIVNIRDLVSQGSLSSCDSILTFLAISRILFQWFIVSFYSIMKDFYTQSFSLWFCRFLLEVVCFLHNMCLWFATWLSVLYCVRVVSISGRIFSTMRRHFDDWLPIIERSGRVFPAQGMANNSSRVINNKSQTINFILRYIVSSLPPFLVFCVAAGLLVYTLWKHTRRMKIREKTSFREPSLRAVHTMATFFMSFVIYVICFNLYLLRESPQECHVYVLILAAYPSAHSVFLVIGNSKLKQTSIEVLKKARCCNTVQSTNTETVTE